METDIRNTMVQLAHAHRLSTGRPFFLERFIYV